MRGKRMARFGWAAALLGLLAASPALGQDDEQTQSFAAMFLWSDSLLGLCIIWLLIVLSMVSIGMALMFALRYRRTAMVPDDTWQNIQQMLEGKRFREAIEYAGNDDSYLGRVINAGLREASNGYSAMAQAVEESSEAETSRILRPIELLNTLGQVAPMMGLFGTVYGMIVAFQQLVAAGGKPDPAKLAAGISTALVTTFWGLVVAIPALAAYSLVRNRIDQLASEGTLAAEELIAPFKPSRKSRGSSSGSGRGQSSSES